MALSESFDTPTLAKLVLAHVDISSHSLRFAPIRIWLKPDKHNTSYWVDSNRGRFVLRVAPPDDAGFLFYERLMMRQEPRQHDLIRATTTIPTAEVIGHDFSRTLIDRDYLVMTALPGTPLSDALGLTQARLNRALHQVGEHLRQLHALTAVEQLEVTAYGYLGEHHPMEPQPTWAAAFRVMWNKLLDDVVVCGCYTAQEAQGMRDLLDLYIELFDRLVTPCLLHMDVWSQNILIDDAGNVTGLVDFDRALWGDMEIEFAVLDYTDRKSNECMGRGVLNLLRAQARTSSGVRNALNSFPISILWHQRAVILGGLRSTTRRVARGHDSPPVLSALRTAKVYADSHLAAKRSGGRQAKQAAEPRVGRTASFRSRAGFAGLMG